MNSTPVFLFVKFPSPGGFRLAGEAFLFHAEKEAKRRFYVERFLYFPLENTKSLAPQKGDADEDVILWCICPHSARTNLHLTLLLRSGYALAGLLR